MRHALSTTSAVVTTKPQQRWWQSTNRTVIAFGLLLCVVLGVGSAYLLGLLELVGVTLDGQRLIAQFSNQLNVAACDFGFHQAQRVLHDRAQVADRSCRLPVAGVVEKHSHNSRDPVDLPDDDLETFLMLPSARLAVQQILGARTYHSHRRADLVSEARGEGADRRKSIRVLKAALEFQLASMPLHEVRTRLGKLLIEAAKLFAQELDFVAADAAA